MMGRKAEQCSSKGLLKAGQGIAKELEKLLIPNSPMAVKILVVRISLIIFRTTEVMSISCRPRKSLESHGTVIRPMKESGIISFFTQFSAYTGYCIQGRRRQKERLYKHRDSR